MRFPITERVIWLIFSKSDTMALSIKTCALLWSEPFPFLVSIAHTASPTVNAEQMQSAMFSVKVSVQFLLPEVKRK